MNERADGFVMIGLHKLAAQNGEGMVPELYELLADRAQSEARSNVTAFPIEAVRPAGVPPVRASGPDGWAARNVVALTRFGRQNGKTADNG